MSILYFALAAVTLVVSLLFTRRIRRGFARFRSRERKAGKELIYRHFPQQKKPLGGGVAMLGAIAAGLLAALLFRIPVPPAAWVWLLAGVLFGGIGLIDDWRKVKSARGLGEWAKLTLQFLAALILTMAVVAVREIPDREPTAVFIPFFGWLVLAKLFIPCGMLVLVAAANAVNLTDGLDGLAGSGLLLAYGGYLALAALLQHETVPAVIPVVAIASLAGFLAYNRPPARIIMGDTGALGLGAALGALALLSGTEWLLILFAAPFVIDTASVVAQVAVIKFFRGPVKLLRHQTTEVFRPFLCTPLHHHFQWLTWGPWPILALFSGVGALSAALGVLALPAEGGRVAHGWFWAGGLLLLAGFLFFAALQKVIRANYFLGLESPPEGGERLLALFKGLPVQVLGVRWYVPEEVTGITEGMVNTIAAEGILWRNISEIEARATLGKIHAEYKMFDRAAEEWEEIPLRNLLIRENLVVQLGKIYYGRDELLRAVKLWEQLPASRLANTPGMLETIQSAKVRIGHLAGRLYHQAREHAAALQRRAGGRATAPTSAEVTALIVELEGALRYTQDLRDLLAYEQRKAEEAGELEGPDGSPDLYHRMDAMLTARREELHEALRWAQELAKPLEDSELRLPLQELSRELHMTPAEISRALAAPGPLSVREVIRIAKPSRNILLRIVLEDPDQPLPERLIAKCYEEGRVTFFSACYRRERGVIQLLQEANAPVPRLFGGHLGSHIAVLFLEDLGSADLMGALAALPPENRAGRLDLLRQGVETLVRLHVRAQAVLPRLEREISKIVKEALTPEYYVTTSAIALNRILALERRQLTQPERGRLEAALRPIIQLLLEEPRTFIHFEYTPGNLQLVEGRAAVAIDFEQSTLGPAAFDLAALLYTPEGNLTAEEVDELVRAYHALLPPTALPALTARPAAIEAAAVIKLLFYAGSAANFYRKFEDGQRLTAMEWYLQTAERLLLANPEYHQIAYLLQQCWSGQRHLQV